MKLLLFLISILLFFFPLIGQIYFLIQHILRKGDIKYWESNINSVAKISYFYSQKLMPDFRLSGLPKE
jgi:hypothetical protein